MNFKNTKTKRLLLLFSFLFLVIIFIFIWANGIENQEDEVEGEISYEISDIQLPDLVTVSADQSPVLYDFINGSLGWKSKINTIEFDGQFFVLARQPEKPNKIFVSYYAVAEEIRVPPLGTNPESYIIGDQEVVLIEDAIKHMDKRRIYNENEWQFLIINEWPIDDDHYNFLNSDYKWCGIDFTKFNDMQNYGRMYTEIYEDGQGFPLDWLQRDEWKDQLYHQLGVDIEDEFWTRWKLYEKRTYSAIDPEKGDDIIITVEGTDILKIEDGGNISWLNEQDLNILLETRGYERRE